MACYPMDTLRKGAIATPVALQFFVGEPALFPGERACGVDVSLGVGGDCDGLDGLRQRRCSLHPEERAKERKRDEGGLRQTIEGIK